MKGVNTVSSGLIPLALFMVVAKRKITVIRKMFVRVMDCDDCVTTTTTMRTKITATKTMTEVAVGEFG